MASRAETMEYQYLSVNNLNVHYRVSQGSSDKAILLFHPFLGSLHTWHAVMDPLRDATTRTVIAFDRPAFGFTERKETVVTEEGTTVSTVSEEFEVEIGVHLLQKLGFKSAICIGNSAGGSVAADLYIKHPEVVEALFLVDAAIYQNYFGPWMMKKVAHQAITPGSVFYDVKKGENAQFMKASKVITAKEEFAPFFWKFVKERTPTMVPRAQRIIQNLKKFGDIPVCIITGANDTVVPADQSERVHKEIPNSEFHKILKCGHIPQEENPEEFISIVSNFIKNKVK